MITTDDIRAIQSVNALELVARFIRRHGLTATVQGGTVHFTDADGMRLRCSTLSEAKVWLGY